MKKRFVVCHNPGTVDQDTAFTVWLASRSLGWWHWLTGSWLVVDVSSTLTAATLRDAVDAAYPGLYNIVLGVSDGSDWAGFGINGGPQDMFGWMNDTWGKL